MAFYTLRESEEHILEDEQHGEHIHQRADLLLLGLAGDHIDDGPGDDADGDTLGDAVSGGHSQNGQEGGKNFMRSFRGFMIKRLAEMLIKKR